MKLSKLFAVATVATALAASSNAQTPDGPYWAELPLPSGFVPGSVKSLGTLVVFQTATDVHLWSAITRSWTVIPVSGGAVVTSFNAYAIIEDGNTVHGFATRIGTVETLNLTSPPVLHHGSITSSWLSIAQDGADLYSFGAFHGKWEHQQMATSAPAISLAQVTGVVHDGVNAWGVSAYHGNFVPTPAATVTQLEVAGDVGVASDATTVRGFASQRNSWSTTNFPTTAPALVQRGYALAVAGTVHLFFSGYTGSFSIYAPSGGFTLSTGRHVAAFTEGSNVTCYAAGGGSISQKTFSNPVLAVEDDLILIGDDSGATAFTGVTGSFSATVPGATISSTNVSIGTAVGSGNFYAYSLIKNVWTAAPSTSTNSVVVANAAILIDSNGYYGFSGRTGEWVFQASTTPLSYQAHLNGDLFVGFEGTSMHLFDPVIVRWSSVTAQQVPGLDMWRQTVVATDNLFGYGAGLMNNQWDSVALQGVVANLDANSSCGYIETNSHLYTYTAHGSFSTLSRWPEFSRYQPKGTDLRLIQSAPAGSSIITLVGFKAAYLSAGAYGTLFVDPVNLIAVPVGTVPAGGLLDITVGVPDLPSLSGATFHMQNGVVTPSGKQWLTSSISPTYF